MNLVKFNNNRFPSLIDELFNDFSFFDDTVPTIRDYRPLGDVIETDEAFTVDLMMPGFKKEDIEMKVEKNALVISAERKKLDETKYNTVESYFGKYKKTYTLPDYVDTDNIDASYENGVLKITVPKTEKVGNRLIEIK